MADSPTPFERAEPADRYAALLLDDLNSSLKLMLTFLMGGAAIQALSSLHGWIQVIASKDVLTLQFPKDMGDFFIFILFCATFIRFYWGGVRFFDLKHVEIPRLLLLLGSYLDKINNLQRYTNAFKEAVASSSSRDITVDVITILYQSTAFFLLGRYINRPGMFVTIYAVLLLLNALYLRLTTRSAEKHQRALTEIGFTPDEAGKIFPLFARGIWIWNNFICGLTIAVVYCFHVWLDYQVSTTFSLDIRNQYYYTSFLVWAFIFIALNCIVDLFLARRLYLRSDTGIEDIWKLCQEKFASYTPIPQRPDIAPTPSTPAPAG